MRRRRIPLVYGTALPADTNLYQYMSALGVLASSSESHRTVSHKISKLLGREIDTWKITSGDEFRALLNEIKQKRGA